MSDGIRLEKDRIRPGAFRRRGFFCKQQAIVCVGGLLAALRLRRNYAEMQDHRWAQPKECGKMKTMGNDRRGACQRHSSSWDHSQTRNKMKQMRFKMFQKVPKRAQKRTDLVGQLRVYFRDLRQNQQKFSKKQGFTGKIHKKDQNWHENCIKNKTA